LETCNVLGSPAIEQNVLEPCLYRRGNGVDVGESNLAPETGYDVRGETQVRSKGFRRPLLHPGADDQEAGVI
jgi:hypothetical protein